MAVKVNDPAVPVSKVVLVELVKEGDCSTVSVKAWVVVPEALVAEMVRLTTPPVFAAGVPLSTPVLASSVRPLGRVPVVTA